MDSGWRVEEEVRGAISGPGQDTDTLEVDDGTGWDFFMYVGVGSFDQRIFTFCSCLWLWPLFSICLPLHSLSPNTSS